MIGLVVEGVQVENIATTQKTLPDFPGNWHAMLNSKSLGLL
jgi:3-phosphoshikimate 1-carboxyvinyltransferase